MSSHGYDNTQHGYYAGEGGAEAADDNGYARNVRFASNAEPRRPAFDWPELKSASPQQQHIDDGDDGADFNLEMNARSSLEPVPANRRNSGSTGPTAAPMPPGMGPLPKRRGPDQRRLDALAVPRGAARAPKPPAKASTTGATSSSSTTTGRPLPMGAGARKAPANSRLAPLHRSPPQPSPGSPGDSPTNNMRRVQSAPESVSSVSPRAYQPSVHAAGGGEAPRNARPVLAPGLRAKSGGRREQPALGKLEPLAHPGNLPRVAGLAPSPSKLSQAEHERHQRVANARTTAVDARVNKMLAEIDRQRAKIDAVMHDQGSFEERKRQVDADRKQAARDRLERLKRREEEHVQRKAALVAERKRNVTQGPMSKGVSRFGPDPSQPIAATQQRGTSIAFVPTPPQGPAKSPTPASQHHNHRHDHHQVRSPSPTRGDGPTLRSPSPDRTTAAAASHDRSPDVTAARERLQAAELERKRAEEELLAAERRAAAAAFVASQREAHAVLDDPVRTVQAFMRSRRAVRASCIRIIARRRRIAEREREMRLLRDINPNYEPSDDDDDNDGEEGTSPQQHRQHQQHRRVHNSDADDDGEDDDEDGESLDGIGLLESDATTSQATISHHASNASLRRSSSRRRRSSVSIVDRNSSTTPDAVRSPGFPVTVTNADDSRRGSTSASPVITDGIDICGSQGGVAPTMVNLPPPPASHLDEPDSSRTPAALGRTLTHVPDEGASDAPEAPAAAAVEEEEDDDDDVDDARETAVRLDVIGAVESAMLCRMQDAYMGAADQ